MPESRDPMKRPLTDAELVQLLLAIAALTLIVWTMVGAIGSSC